MPLGGGGVPPDAPVAGALNAVPTPAARVRVAAARRGGGGCSGAGPAGWCGAQLGGRSGWAGVRLGGAESRWAEDQAGRGSGWAGPGQQLRGSRAGPAREPGGSRSARRRPKPCPARCERPMLLAVPQAAYLNPPPVPHRRHRSGRSTRDGSCPAGHPEPAAGRGGVSCAQRGPARPSRPGHARPPPEVVAAPLCGRPAFRPSGPSGSGVSGFLSASVRPAGAGMAEPGVGDRASLGRALRTPRRAALLSVLRPVRGVPRGAPGRAPRPHNSRSSCHPRSNRRPFGLGTPLGAGRALAGAGYKPGWEGSRGQGDRRLAGTDARFTEGAGWGAEGGPRHCGAELRSVPAGSGAPPRVRARGERGGLRGSQVPGASQPRPRKCTRPNHSACLAALRRLAPPPTLPLPSRRRTPAPLPPLHPLPGAVWPGLEGACCLTPPVLAQPPSLRRAF